MTKKQLQKATIAELAAAFAEEARAQGIAIEQGDHRKGNKAYDRRVSIYSELRRRGLDARKGLLPLLFDPDPWVRVAAASRVLDFATAEGEAVLERVAAGGGGVATTAHYTLEEWRNGNLELP